MHPLPVHNRARGVAFAACVVVALGLFTAASWAVAKPLSLVFRSPRPWPSTVIFPAQSIPLQFSHELHLTKVGMDCDFCHANAEDSTRSTDMLIPTEQVCSNCHSIDRTRPNLEVHGKPPSRCVACHPGWKGTTASIARVSIDPPNIKFSHKQHLDKNIECKVCHGDFVVEQVEMATRQQLPTMSLCLSCHRKKKVSTQCVTCHLAAAGARIETRFPSGSLKPSGSLRGAEHNAAFLLSHKRAAQNDPAFCESCHRKPFCTNCHMGDMKPMQFHLGDYVAIHSVEARRDATKCDSCHRAQSFCVGCHSRSGVSPDGRMSEFRGAELSGIRGRRFHRRNWTDSHGPYAQRNIKQCASCHREETCLSCHGPRGTLGGAPVSPHPASWAGSWRCKSLAVGAGRMCLRCHVNPGSPALDCMSTR